MENIAHLWNLIIHSNTFNFVIFILVLAYICKKIDVSSIIAKLQEKIKQMIEDSDKAKDNAHKNLSEAEEKVKNVKEEVDTILQDANTTASRLSEKISDDTQKQVENIKKNTEKVIEAEEKVIYTSLMKKASVASIQTAEKHIKEVLANNESLHDKYINESIDELDGLNI